jgi:hypothetical protein
LNPKKRQHSNERTLLQGANVVANKRKKLTQTKKQTIFLANQTKNKGQQLSKIDSTK